MQLFDDISILRPALTLARGPTAHLERLIDERAQHVLAVVAYGDTVVSSQALLRVDALPLATEVAPIDVWLAAGAVRGGSLGPASWTTDGNVMFGRVVVDETEIDQAAAQRAYEAVFAALYHADCPELLRLWNYVPHINRDGGGLERYRQFNIGRQNAFLGANRSAAAGAPAACAVGTTGEALIVHFLAARERPTAIENPRQVSAYHYPREYGPRAPTFSRAALARMNNRLLLFISGTASIVGHRSLHAHDVVAQVRETMDNIAALLHEANSRLPEPAFSMAALDYTIYIRRAAESAVALDAFNAIVGKDSHAARAAIIVQADICRAELQVEIEANGSGAD